MNESITLALTAIVLLASICQWVAWKIKLPAIIFLLLCGIVAGPVSGLLQPDLLLGELLFPFVSLSVAVILFEGSLTLKFREIRGMGNVVSNMVSFGMVITLIVTILVTRWALGLSWNLSLLFGAISVVTGPTVIVPILRTVRPTAKIANILRWEGIVIDPIGASLAVLVYEFIIAGGGQEALGHTLQTFGLMVASGIVIGTVGGYLFGLLLKNHYLPEFLHNITTLALVFSAYTGSNMVAHESGLLCVTVMGILLTNMKGVDIKEILDFKESLSILLISVLFILLAARMNFDDFKELGFNAIFVLLAIQFIARPLNILASCYRSSLTWPERHLLAWIAPRGIVAAAVSALFAIQLENYAIADSHLLVPLTFTIITGTVLIQATTAGFIAKRLGVAEPDPKGFLIIGADQLARAIGTSLEQNGLRVLLADTDWEKTAKAKLAGLPIYFGNPISEHADRHLDLVGIGRMLALAPKNSVNAAAIMHYRMELGANNVFMIKSKPENEGSDHLKHQTKRRGQTLFGYDVNRRALLAILESGGEIRTTKLTATFGFKKYREQHKHKAILLFTLDPKDKLHIFTAERSMVPGPGWSLISLIPPPD